MKINSSMDIAQIAMKISQNNIKSSIEVNLLKKMLQMSEELMKQMIEKNLQTPPANDKGNISLYA